MYYYLEKKTGEDYICLGRVYFQESISGYYWEDEETIHYLRKRHKDDGSLYWIGYAGRFVAIE